MSPTACNNRGITIVEVLITLFLTAVGIMALLSMQPTSWNAAGRSDFMGRAAGILQSELERNEIHDHEPGKRRHDRGDGPEPPDTPAASPPRRPATFPSR